MGAGANAIGFGASRKIAQSKVKKINNMTRTQQKHYVNRKLYRGSQASINVNYRSYKTNKVGTVESKLRSFKSGVYSTITSMIAGLFRR